MRFNDSLGTLFWESKKEKIDRNDNEIVLYNFFDELLRSFLSYVLLNIFL